MKSCTHAEQYSVFARTIKTAEFPQARLSRPIQHASLAQAIEALPELQRFVLSLIYIEELSFFETAAVMQRAEDHIQCLHDQALISLAPASSAQPAAT